MWWLIHPHKMIIIHPRNQNPRPKFCWYSVFSFRIISHHYSNASLPSFFLSLLLRYGVQNGEQMLDITVKRRDTRIIKRTVATHSANGNQICSEPSIRLFTAKLYKICANRFWDKICTGTWCFIFYALGFALFLSLGTPVYTMYESGGSKQPHHFVKMYNYDHGLLRWT